MTSEYGNFFLAARNRTPGPMFSIQKERGFTQVIHYLFCFGYSVQKYWTAMCVRLLWLITADHIYSYDRTGRLTRRSSCGNGVMTRIVILKPSDKLSNHSKNLSFHVRVPTLLISRYKNIIPEALIPCGNAQRIQKDCCINVSVLFLHM